jgi:hypothetical protein
MSDRLIQWSVLEVDNSNYETGQANDIKKNSEEENIRRVFQWSKDD